MQKVEYCQALPGCCWSCGSSNRKWYIDTERSIDYYGAVYLCNECIEEWGSIAGMTSVEDTKSLNLKIEHQETEIFDLIVKVSGLEQAIDGLRFAGSVSRHSSQPSDVLSSDSSTETVPEREKSVGLEGGTPPESSNDKGVGELHSTESRSDESGFTLNL